MVRTGATGQSLAGSGEQHATCSPPSLSAQVLTAPRGAGQGHLLQGAFPTCQRSLSSPWPCRRGVPLAPFSGLCCRPHRACGRREGAAVSARSPSAALPAWPSCQSGRAPAASPAPGPRPARSRPLPGRTPSPVLCVPRLRTLPGTARLLRPSLLTPSLPLHVVSKPLPTSTSICLKTHSFPPAAGRLSHAL